MRTRRRETTARDDADVRAERAPNHRRQIVGAVPRPPRGQIPGAATAGSRRAVFDMLRPHARRGRRRGTHGALPRRVRAKRPRPMPESAGDAPIGSRRRRRADVPDVPTRVGRVRVAGDDAWGDTWTDTWLSDMWMSATWSATSDADGDVRQMSRRHSRTRSIRVRRVRVVRPLRPVLRRGDVPRGARVRARGRGGGEFRVRVGGRAGGAAGGSEAGRTRLCRGSGAAATAAKARARRGRERELERRGRASVGGGKRRGGVEPAGDVARAQREARRGEARRD